jgi:hypothetical protein
MTRVEYVLTSNAFDGYESVFLIALRAGHSVRWRVRRFESPGPALTHGV